MLGWVHGTDARAPRAARRGHELRVLRRPHRAAAERPRRRPRHRQLRHRAGGGRFRPRPCRTAADPAHHRGDRLPGAAARRRHDPATARERPPRRRAPGRVGGAFPAGAAARDGAVATVRRLAVGGVGAGPLPLCPAVPALAFPRHQAAAARTRVGGCPRPGHAAGRSELASPAGLPGHRPFATLDGSPRAHWRGGHLAGVLPRCKDRRDRRQRGRQEHALTDHGWTGYGLSGRRTDDRWLHAGIRAAGAAARPDQRRLGQLAGCRCTQASTTPALRRIEHKVW